MDFVSIYMTANILLVPVFSAIICSALVAFSLQDCQSYQEKKLKCIALAYLLISGTGWFVTFCYEINPVWFVYLNVVCLLSYVFPSIFFYRIIRMLTRIGSPEHFPLWHYVLPLSLGTALLTWSLFVPFDAQLQIVTSKAEILPQEYEIFARFFTTKPLWRVIFGLMYYLFTILLLIHYYKRANVKEAQVQQPARWVIFLIGISIASLFSSLLPTFMPRSKILHSVWTLIVSLSIALQHILLSYHIIRRNYTLFIVLDRRNPSRTTKKYHKGELNRSRFEGYFCKHSPYLDPDYKITDLSEALNVSRTSLSFFINQEYHVTFTRYLNQWRLKKMNYLRLQPQNQGKSMSTLAKQAGFKDYRHYVRAIKIEKEENNKEKETNK